MLCLRADVASGEIKSHMLEFDSAGDAARWAACFMTEVKDLDMDELHLVNLEHNITITMIRKPYTLDETK